MPAHSSPALAAILASPDLPTLPAVAARLLSLMTEEESSLADVAAVVAQDAALAAKVLRVVNSALYSFPEEITTVHRAVPVLGSNAVRNLVLSFSLLSMQGDGGGRFNYSRFWERSLTTAAGAMVIARQLSAIDKEEVFIAGLLQNIGQLIFATTVPDKLDTIQREVSGEIDTAAKSFGLNMAPKKSVIEILQEANLNLGRLNLSYEELNLELQQHKSQLEELARQLQEKNALLENLAYRDALTGIANHRQFQASLDQEINRSTRQGTILSLLLLDIDWFKTVNDTYGHPAGDQVLQEFCTMTSKSLRDYDLFARYGGEEFAVILPDTPPDGARTVAEKIRQQTEEQLFCREENGIRITVSIGLTSVRPAYQPSSKSQFIDWADKALYQAKSDGRNRMCYHQPAKRLL
jgi:diguanylate cyclase (GGDEF)-like protein